MPREAMRDMENVVTMGNGCARCFFPDFYSFDEYTEGVGEKVGGSLGKYAVKKITKVGDVINLADCLKQCRNSEDAVCSIP